MTKIVKFSPGTTNTSGLKDPITFSITELGPFKNDLLIQGRRVSAIPETSVWKQQSVDAAQSAAQQNQILYISTSATSSSTISDATTLVPATQAQIQSEIQSATNILTAKRAELSNLSLLPTQKLESLAEQYNANLSSSGSLNNPIDLAGLFYNAPGTTFTPLATPALGLRLATKGNILDIIGTPGVVQNNVKQGHASFLFTAYQQTSAPVVRIAEGDKLEVASLSPFRLPNGNTVPIIGLVNTTTNVPSRDVFFFKVLELIPATPTTSARVHLQATTFSPVQTVTPDQGTPTTPFNAAFTYLFSIAEIDFFNQAQLGTLTAVPGYPLLWSARVDPAVQTLQEYLTILQNEVPLTKLYLSTSTQPQDKSGRFVGNLDRNSLRVVIHDGDNSVIAIDQGEAQPGFSISYTLNASAQQSTQTEAGDVDISIQLSGFPARLPIVGQPVLGVQGVQVGVPLGTTPASAEAVPAFKDVFSAQTIKNEASGQAILHATEFFFNLQIKNSQGTVVGLNKYGVIRLGDKVSLLSPDGKTVFFQTSIQSVDVTNKLVFFKDPVPSTMPQGTILEVPQSPLTPGRRYRVSVSCQDRLGAFLNG